MTPASPPEDKGPAEQTEQQAEHTTSSSELPPPAETESAWEPWKRWLLQWLPSKPQVQIKEVLETLQRDLPQPRLLLLGEPQVGKSSVVHTLTGDPRAQIGLGDGVPVTAEVQAYHFPPGADIPLWTFLDTPGLGTKHQDLEAVHFERLLEPAQLGGDASQSLSPHLILACVRADDHALAILPWLRRASEALSTTQPIPVLVVQTCLHRVMHPHPEPYPFGRCGAQLPATLPQATITALAQQRTRIVEEIPQAHFVVVDLTDPEDEVGDPQYGADALLEATFARLPEAITLLLRRQGDDTFADLYGREAETLIWRYAMSAAGAGALPPPVGDLATIAIALTLLQQLASLYNQPWQLKTVVELLLSLGSTSLLWLLLRYLARRIPVPVLMAPVGAIGAFTLVFSLGRLMAWYYAEIQEGHQPSTAEVQEHWRSLQQSSKSLAKDALQRLWPPGSTPADPA